MKRILCAILILFSIIVFCKMPSFAEEEILIIFDASLSMADTINDVPKYKIASREINNYLDSLPDTTKIGFRTVGMTLDYRIFDVLQNPNYFCEASQLINQIQSNNVFNIKRSIDEIFPLGTTPLTFSLKSAIENDFSQYANPKHIILITDGAESCDANPCLYAREIMSKRSDVKIDILAINVNTGDIEQLKCISNATGGTLFDIKNSDDLKSAFNSIRMNKNKPSSFSSKGTKIVDIPKPENTAKSLPIINNEIVNKLNNTNNSNNEIKYKNYFIEVLK